MHAQKGIVRDVLKVVSGNIFTIISGIVVGMLVPKILTIDAFGYYKTFTLYASYLGLCSVGIIDGIVLKYGNYDLEQLDKIKFRSYFSIYVLIHLLFAALIAVIAIIQLKGGFRFIAISLSFYLMFTNIIGYFQQISQITQRFKEYASVKICQALLNTITVLILYVIYTLRGELEYYLYLGVTVLINGVIAFWYVHTYKELVFGKKQKFSSTKSEIIGFIINGTPLLIANLCSTLILTIDRQFVNVLFDNQTYAVYAFAYSMLALITTAVSAISIVLYPTLKRSSRETLKNNYSTFIAIILILINASLLLYFILNAFVMFFIPKYRASLVIFRIIFPGLTISSAITIVIQNYYKTYNKSFSYFVKELVVLSISIMANYIAYFTVGTTASISIASILTMIIWFVLTDMYFERLFKSKYVGNYIYLILVMGLFYYTSGLESVLWGGVIYILGFVILTAIIYKGEIESIKGILKK